MPDSITTIDARAGLEDCLQVLRDRAPRRPPAHIERSAREIVERVQAEGDAAVVEYTARFDCPTFDAAQLGVDAETLAVAYDQVPVDWLRALRRARENVRAYHEAQMPRSW